MFYLDRLKRSATDFCLNGMVVRGINPRRFGKKELPSYVT
ncbi:hypothetical protein DICVIV_06512 [Dictyocaulus viviparus]|uniref:Uncharacterized protein n=1 Tax=Dictyocaulus viviparus TaxID=29172 RepID=A0A0D8XYF6_DICVI|nr:hypothetical protein DICVIV_06512 [Dictyocaulus viviparus]